MLLELAGLEVALVAKGLISSTLLGEQHGQHGPDVLLLFAVEHHGFEPVQWGPVGVLAQVGPNVSGLWDSILSSLTDARQASMLPAPAASASLANSQASKAERVLFRKRLLTRRRNLSCFGQPSGTRRFPGSIVLRQTQRRNMHAAVLKLP